MYKYKNTYYIKSISYTYDYEFMTENDIIKMFADIVDCIYSQLPDVDEEEILEIPIDQKVRCLVKSKYIKLC